MTTQAFFSNHSIDDEVEFVPMFRQQNELGISDEVREGKVIAVRFTKPKIFYDILDIYYGIIFKEVDSVKVFAPKIITVQSNQTEIKII